MAAPPGRQTSGGAAVSRGTNRGVNVDGQPPTYLVPGTSGMGPDYRQCHVDGQAWGSPGDRAYSPRQSRAGRGLVGTRPVVVRVLDGTVPSGAGYPPRSSRRRSSRMALGTGSRSGRSSATESRRPGCRACRRPPAAASQRINRASICGQARAGERAGVLQVGLRNDVYRRPLATALERLGLAPGWSCVDVGAGAVTSRWVWPRWWAGRPCLRRRQRSPRPVTWWRHAAAAGAGQVLAITQAGEDLLLPEPVDLAFCRFLFLHVVEPCVVLRSDGGRRSAPGAG